MQKDKLKRKISTALTQKPVTYRQMINQVLKELEAGKPKPVLYKKPWFWI